MSSLSTTTRDSTYLGSLRVSEILVKEDSDLSKLGCMVFIKYVVFFFYSYNTHGKRRGGELYILFCCVIAF